MHGVPEATFQLARASLSSLALAVAFPLTSCYFGKLDNTLPFPYI